jgi:pimeloyl-ACP methyl ester carboxylesterase
VADRRAERAPGVAARGLSAAVRGPAVEPGGRIVHLRSQDGLRLAARIFDAPPSRRRPVLCLAGLSRNSRDFIALGSFLSSHPLEPRRVVALDYRGRGLSDAEPDWRRYTPVIEAQDVLAVTAALGIDGAVLVGTSRGGLIAMLLGALRPGLMAGAVLNDIGPVIEGTGLARIKKYLAGQRSFASWAEAEAAVRAAAGSSFPALSDADWQAFTRAFFAEGRKGVTPQFDPNLTKAVGSIDFSAKIPTLWPQFASLRRHPLLVIRGENSDILSARSLAAMAAQHPEMQQLTVRGQGHAPLLRDLPTLERIRAFAEACDPAERA